MLPQDNDLPTIDSVALASLNNDLEDLAPLPPATPTVPSTVSSTPKVPHPSLQEVVADIHVGDKLIGSCITPWKMLVVRNILHNETKRHKCALQLLSNFFTKEELSNGNTNGTHSKMPLDSTKLNSMKVLVLSKFLAESSGKGQGVEGNKRQEKCQVSFK